MTWDAHALPHVGHKAHLLDVRRLRCSDCDVTLIVPKDPNGATPTPPRWQQDRDDLRPMPHGLKEQVAAEIAARSAARLRVRQDTTTPEPTAETKEQTNE